MNTAYDAVVDLWGPTCRVAVGSRAPVQWYAHTEQTLAAAPGPALFAASALSEAQAEALTAVHAQLKATLRTADVGVRTLYVVVHPPAALTVQAPLRADAARTACRRALTQQAALLSGARHAQALRLAMTRVRAPLPAPETLRWHRGLVLPDTARARVRDWADAVAATEMNFVSSTARVCDTAAPKQHDWHLGIGCYPDHTEYAVWHGAACAYLYYTPLATTPNDRAYFAALLLNRLQLTQAGLAAAWTYGPVAQHAASMPPIAGVQPRIAQLPHAEAMHRLRTPNPSAHHVLRWAAVHSTLAHASEEEEAS